MSIFKRKKVYSNPSIYINAKEFRLWLDTVPDDTNIRVNGGLVVGMHYHEITGITLDVDTWG